MGREKEEGFKNLSALTFYFFFSSFFPSFFSFFMWGESLKNF
jgi:hypothetical protein